jgi:hypothetical protein
MAGPYCEIGGPITKFGSGMRNRSREALAVGM